MTYSLFLGRWQPFHDGHKEIVEQVLHEGKQVVIAIRDTPLGPANPYTVEERREMITNSLKEYDGQYKIVVLPDITEVCYGRTPGWKMREIQSASTTSGTQARYSNGGCIVWLTGNSGAGKTTLANKVQGAIVLDGDEMRASISEDAGFSLADREAHNRRVARLAGTMAARGHLVIVAVIAPTEAIRQVAQEEAQLPIHWVYIKRELGWGDDRPYDPPQSPALTLDHDTMSIEESTQCLLAFLETVR
jgi:cytidyltransferase-like protein